MIGETEQGYRVLADLGLDQDAGGCARNAEACDRLGAGVQDIADAVDVEQQPVLVEAVDDAGQLADHRAARGNPWRPSG